MRSPERKRSFAAPLVGGSSLLVIFAVLCLTIFTLLTLSTVQADRRLSEASIQAVTDYYAADSQAQQIFAQLRSGQIPTGVQQKTAVEADLLPDTPAPSGTIFFYSCPISDTQTLMVQIYQDQNSWTVLQWQAVSTVTYE